MIMNTTMTEMNLNQMENVNGATSTELSELIEACSGSHISGLNGFTAGIPACSRIAKPLLVNLLKNLDIQASFSTGFMGLGAAPNTYKDLKTGRSLTHQEVIDIIKRHHT